MVGALLVAQGPDMIELVSLTEFGRSQPASMQVGCQIRDILSTDELIVLQCVDDGSLITL